MNTNLSIVTSVQFDHMNILGDTLDQIAAEKCGIFRPGVDALIAPGVPIDVARVMHLKTKMSYLCIMLNFARFFAADG